MSIFIHTNRLTIRPYTLDDLEHRHHLIWKAP